MLSKEQIRAHLYDSLIEMCEIQGDAIHTDARLYEGLDIDSLDAVDVVIELREFTGVKVQPEQLKKVRTGGDAVHALIEPAAASASMQ